MRNYQQLSQDERYYISKRHGIGDSLSEIARVLHRDTSTISREIKRNKRNYDGGYRAETAHEHALAKRKKARRGSQFTMEQWEQVILLIQIDWSPDQISNHFKFNGTFTISHQTIYKLIKDDKKAGGSLHKHLRNTRKQRRKQYKSHDSRGVLPGKRNISERPKEVEHRLVVGHWEGDTVIGNDGHHCVLTLVERKSGFVIIKKLSARTAEGVVNAAFDAIYEHLARFITITFDNGTEFHRYKELENHFPIKCYFANPYHSWERGTNENTNGLIRQYLPKKTSMAHITQSDCDWIANRLNTRPRKRHGYKTPEEVYYAE